MGVGGPQVRYLPLPPNRHRDEELGTVQKPDLTAREGWSVAPCKSQGRTVPGGGGTVPSSQTGTGPP